VHCTALHCTALHCTALHCTALHCTAHHCTALHCTALHITALHYTALHFTALHISKRAEHLVSGGFVNKLPTLRSKGPALQCSAVQCSAAGYWSPLKRANSCHEHNAAFQQQKYLPAGGLGSSAVQCSAVQCSAVQCSAVQCSAGRVIGEHAIGFRPPSTPVTYIQHCTTLLVAMINILLCLLAL
jgi:hypothetical protein